MPTERIRVGVAVVNDTFYVIGGYTLAIGNNVGTNAVNKQYTSVGYIPKFPSWTILPLLLMATLVVAIYRRKLSKTSKSSFILGD